MLVERNYEKRQVGEKFGFSISFVVMRIAFFLIFQLIAVMAAANTWHVGLGRQYTKPSQVMSLVQRGDTVEIDSGLYVKDVGAWNQDSLVLRCRIG